MCHACAWYPQRPKVGIRSPRTGVTGDCKLPCGYWESNFGSLQEQLMLLITELSTIHKARTWWQVWHPLRSSVKLIVYHTLQIPCLSLCFHRFNPRQWVLTPIIDPGVLCRQLVFPVGVYNVGFYKQCLFPLLGELHYSWHRLRPDLRLFSVLGKTSIDVAVWVYTLGHSQSSCKWFPMALKISCPALFLKYFLYLLA